MARGSRGRSSAAERDGGGAGETLTDASLPRALEHLRVADPKLRAVIDAGGWSCDGLVCPSASPSCFAALARSIVYQQLAGAAAGTIFGRLVALCGGEPGLTPSTILGLDEARLRGVGLSGQKLAYLVDLARHFADGRLSDDAIAAMDDEQLSCSLRAVKGIGEWTLHMFMMFALKRADVLPTGDLAVRKGFAALYGIGGADAARGAGSRRGGGKKAAKQSLPTPAEMECIAEKWRPFRSLGAYLMWHVCGIAADALPTAEAAPTAVDKPDSVLPSTPDAKPRAGSARAAAAPGEPASPAPHLLSRSASDRDGGRAAAPTMQTPSASRTAAAKRRASVSSPCDPVAMSPPDDGGPTRAVKASRTRMAP